MGDSLQIVTIVCFLQIYFTVSVFQNFSVDVRIRYRELNPYTIN
jgi:hypothetical protein